MGSNDEAQRLKVFVCYSHQDTDALARLRIHLESLEAENEIEVWSDERIEAGHDWHAEIQRALKSANVAILLLSQDFLASKYIRNNELPRIMESAEAGGLTVLTVIVKPVSRDRNARIFRFQAVNAPERSLLELTAAQQERVWIDLTDRLSRIASHPR